MAAVGLRRLLVVSGDLQFPDGGPPAFLRTTILRHLDQDQAELERIVQASGLDWTIVRPTRLTNAAMTGRSRAEVGRMPGAPKGISRADVAHFLLGAAERALHVREIVGLAR